VGGPPDREEGVAGRPVGGPVEAPVGGEGVGIPPGRLTGAAADEPPERPLPPDLPPMQHSGGAVLGCALGAFVVVVGGAVAAMVGVAMWQADVRRQRWAERDEVRVEEQLDAELQAEVAAEVAALQVRAAETLEGALARGPDAEGGVWGASREAWRLGRRLVARREGRAETAPVVTSGWVDYGPGTVAVYRTRLDESGLGDGGRTVLDVRYELLAVGDDGYRLRLEARALEGDDAGEAIEDAPWGWSAELELPAAAAGRALEGDFEPLESGPAEVSPGEAGVATRAGAGLWLGPSGPPVHVVVGYDPDLFLPAWVELSGDGDRSVQLELVEWSPRERPR